ncbi:MAG: DNA helicase UvrD [Candidatus Niyogibacteria bacterium]|nr:DNA helicase UvrD [Candidatus Niyogibacteria bacterium]
MKFIADLHIHSKWSRATSKSLCLEELDRWADDKGILVMGTGDFTHPAWFKEIKTKLEPAESGLYRLKNKYKLKTLKGTFAETRFLLTVEISGIYSRGGRARRVHNIVLAPDMATAEKIIAQLSLIGNLRSDGRPILGLDSEELAKIVLEINSRAVIIPAHVWTPWFSLFGSMSGFDSLEECFGKMSKHIFALETGLSSDPSMNWRLSALDNLALISNSDSHSLQKIGREANIFDTELSYEGIMGAIKSGAPNQKSKVKNQKSKFVATIEFFPEEGKYHYDGHRACGVVFSPEETEKHKSLCPKCGKPVVVGVLNRVAKLSDRKTPKIAQNFYHESVGRVPYYNLVPLDEVVSEALGVGTASKKVKEKYNNLIVKFGSELNILLNVSPKELESAGESRIAEAVRRLREGRVNIKPGYDGEYGEVSIF